MVGKYLHSARKLKWPVKRAHHLHWSSAEHLGHAEPRAAPSEMLSGLLLEDAVLFNATKKISNPPDKVLFLGMLAGIWVGLGGLAAVSAAGGVPESIRTQWILLPRLLMGSFFAFGERGAQ